MLETLVTKVDSLEQGQAAMQADIADLKQGQTVTNARLDRLDVKTDRLETKIDEGLAFAKATVDYLGHDVASIEERLLEHIDAPMH